MLADQLQLVACAIKAMEFGPNNTAQTGTFISHHKDNQHCVDNASENQALRSDYSGTSEYRQFSARTSFLISDAVIISRDDCKRCFLLILHSQQSHQSSC